MSESKSDSSEMFCVFFNTSCSLWFRPHTVLQPLFCSTFGNIKSLITQHSFPFHNPQFLREMAPCVEAFTRQSESWQLQSFTSYLLFYVWVRRSQRMNKTYCVSFWTRLAFNNVLVARSLRMPHIFFPQDPTHLRNGCRMLGISLSHSAWRKGPNIDSNVVETNNRRFALNSQSVIDVLEHVYIDKVFPNGLCLWHDLVHISPAHGITFGIKLTLVLTRVTVRRLFKTSLFLNIGCYNSALVKWNWVHWIKYLSYLYFPFHATLCFYPTTTQRENVLLYYI